MKTFLSVDLTREAVASLIACIVVLLLFSGCDFVSGFKKEAKEEKKILGYTKGYNPRIKDLEKVLFEEGFSPGAVDGNMDAQARKAIREFQGANKLKGSGFYDMQTKVKLDGIRSEKAKKRQEVLARQEALAREIELQEKVKKAQQALKKAGFDPGPVSGAVNDKTKKAITDFQKSKGLAVDGALGQKTLDELNKYLPKN